MRSTRVCVTEARNLCHLIERHALPTATAATITVEVSATEAATNKLTQPVSGVRSRDIKRSKLLADLQSDA